MKQESVGMFNEILRMTKCSFTLSINEHKDDYSNVEKYIETSKGYNGPLSRDITEEKRMKMIEKDTIIEMHCYKDTPVGFFYVCGYDLDMCIEEMYNTLKENDKIS